VLRIRPLLFLGAALLAVPMAVELATTPFGRHEGAALALLLYRPVPFAYPLAALALFVALSIFLARRSGANPLVGGIVGLGFGLAWFAVAFMSVAQLHISLGGKL
jgi:hypothetical protein